MITPALQLSTLSVPPVPWRERATAAAKSFIRFVSTGPSPQLTGEDVRFDVERCVGSPSHPNAWGGLIRSLVKDGFLRGTGVHVPMTAKSSHGRQTPLYNAVNVIS